MADKIDKSLTQGPRGSVTIPGEEELTEKIQEVHIMFGHIICYLVEEKIFKK